MDDSSALIQDYILTIDSMRNEAEKLRLELSQFPSGDSDSDEADNIEALKEVIEALNQEIENIHGEISDQTSSLLDLNVDEEWIRLKFPQSQKIVSLQQDIHKATQSLYKAREKKMHEETMLKEVEKLKNINPKLYTLVKKMIQAEKTNLQLKNSIINSEEDRKNMRIEYAKITTALGLEDKIKRRIKEVEEEVHAKEIVIENLSKNLNEVRRKTEDTMNSIENSDVKDILKKSNEVKAVRAYYAEQMEKLRKENVDILKEIEVTEKNPKKIPPAVANQNLRSEVKNLEVQITERSKEIKEKEREKFQANFHLEEAQKVMAEIKTKVDELTAKPKPKVQPKQEVKEKKVVVNPAQAMRKIEAKRDSVLELLGKGINDDTGKEMMKVLKTVGKPGQGLASKVLELNRSQFPQSRPLNK
ncbi:hypothetical protein SteCoe_33467 [Stentor coeruleus]|uniref:Uncharacterized protein n=1 Tax=Stentor coeruleus TaxID=5963 RepID=A0A1R2AWP6_9CILI|nr:hypothetical protein SteCoe_33467 [Stentor coeruleus]